ncbi:MAG: ABC transporter permease subunit [Chlorobium sp.]|uniref:molybdate ABC transporter permease subunit n=1 Tax=Chlorobium sp. TaxID=1095 RepID=UPI001D3659C6|nr:ABC transporter permease subunit [Chlorobium sp.]MBN1278884.1 ABC transporter permease subunit [Chlorobiaceae bacterium]MCF8216729.1 ABC transporter permease subunit [Chlorobium sp.]MCF8271596.1 ABC transporter permease subunit [Chlorobium sp.]MCF8287969.1 ABC transporter permease subunit [Chlorobium sp.]MCF8291513.1 ABC transporter permease subunit [Chlorobium sp.]
MNPEIATYIQENGAAGPMLLSLGTAAITLILHLIAGLLSGYLLTGRKTILRTIADTAITLPLIFPPIATGFLLLLLLGRNGIIGQPLQQAGIEIIFSTTGVYAASFIAGLPLVVKSVQTAVETMDRSLLEASWTLGKNRTRTYLFVVLPHIRHALLTGLVLSLGRSFGEVGITLMLGGNIAGKTETMSLAIYNAVFEGNIEKAAFLSILLAVISLGMFAILKKVTRNGNKSHSFT